MEPSRTRDLCEIADYRSNTCLSLYLAGAQPVHRWIGRALARLERDLDQQGTGTGEAGPLLARVIQDAAQSAPPCTIPPQRSEAIFWSPGFLRRISIVGQIAQRVMVSNRFFIDPLLNRQPDATRFHVLALTPRSARLYEGDSSQIRNVWFPAPRPYAEPDARSRPWSPSQLLKGWRGQGSAAKTPVDPLPTPSPVDAAEVIEYFRQVDQCIRRALRGENSPLVLACVGYLALLYRSANTYPHLIGCKIPGCPDRWSLVELQRNAWRLVAPYLADASQRLLARPAEPAAPPVDDAPPADRVEISFERPASTSHPSAPTGLYVTDEPGSSWTPLAG